MEENNTSRVIMININDILPNRFQPRIEFDEDEILGLSASIKKHGIINPILVRKISDKYEIIAGERRYKAAVLAGLEQVPVILKELSDKDSAEIALLENIQRKDMSSIEEAISIQKILDMGYLTQVQLAEQLGKSQSYIANKLRLLKLSDEVQEALLKNKISERHARSLLRIKNNEEQNKMLNKIIEQRLTVRKTDEEIEKMNNNMLNNNENINNLNQTIPSSGSQEIIPTSLDNIFGTNVVPTIPAVDVQPEVQNDQTQQIDENSKFFSFGTPETNDEVVQPNIVGTSEGVNLANEILSSTPADNVFQSPISTPLSSMTQDNSTIPVVEPQETPTVPEVPTIEATPLQPNYQFDANGNVVSMPTQTEPTVENIIPIMPEIPAVPVQPEVPPVTQEIPTTPIIETPTVPEVPTIEATQSQPNYQFDANGNVVSMPTQTEPPVENITPIMPEIPAVPVQPKVPPVTQEIPTTPIIETPTVPEAPTMEIPPIPQQNDNYIQPDPVIGTTINEENVQKIEPIIITDYNKQYDPIMPDKEPPAPTVDFREIINMIRDCSNQIENSGYVIDTEEYDLEGMYQVVFKIEKK